MIYGRPICVLLAAVLLGMPMAWADGSATPQEEQRRAVENPLATMSFDQLTETRERPLFLPERRRPSVAAVVSHVEAPPPPPPPPPQLSLFGVIVDADGPRAVIRAEPTGKILRAHLGDEIGGWRVTEIEGRRLVISLDDRSVAVTMFAGPQAVVQIAKMHAPDRVYEVNAAGVLRSHRIHKNQ